MPLIEKKLTPKQQEFADYYIELGNALDAAIKAGYSKYANAQSYKLLENVGVKSYIDNRMEELKFERVANQKEIEIGIGRCFDSVYQSSFFCKKNFSSLGW
jgi:phage terminase small subunit